MAYNAFMRLFQNKPSSSENKEEKRKETPDIAARYKNELSKKGMAGVKDFINDDLNGWQHIPLNIAVTGNSGTGKSSFINTLRGLTARQPGAAKVGVTETTKECTQYEHPDNKSFLVWDLPGVGTPEFKRDEYLAKVGYDKYDFFIIVSKSRFTENDMWLAKEVKNRNKTFFFVRTNMKADIENEMNDSDLDEDTIIHNIKQSTENSLREDGDIPDPKVFLIDNHHRARYEFGKLNNELLKSCEGLKKDAVALSLSAVTREVIDEKKRVLEGRINSVALKITTSSNDDEQKRLFQGEINFYLKQFNVDVTTLSENKDILSINEKNMREFRIVVDGAEHDAGTSVKSPTALRREMSVWKRFADIFTWSKEDTLLYGFCKKALENNLNLLHQKAKDFYDERRVKAMISVASSK